MGVLGIDIKRKIELEISVFGVGPIDMLVMSILGLVLKWPKYFYD
jgi:hypothetical protein